MSATELKEQKLPLSLRQIFGVKTHSKNGYQQRPQLNSIVAPSYKPKNLFTPLYYCTTFSILSPMCQCWLLVPTKIYKNFQNLKYLPSTYVAYTIL